MRHLKINTPLDLKQLQKAFARSQPDGICEFWLSRDGQYAQAEAQSHDLIGLQPSETGIKLLQQSGPPQALEALASWIQAQEPA